MNIEHVKKQLEKRAQLLGLVFELGQPASEAEIAEAEIQMQVEFPFQLRLFYTHYNGLRVLTPPLVVYQLKDLHIDLNRRIPFAVLDSVYELAFDTKFINAAGQWDIICINTDYVVTVTFASFWSNKIWGWIDKQRQIWKPWEAPEIIEEP